MCQSSPILVLIWLKEVTGKHSAFTSPMIKLALLSISIQKTNRFFVINSYNIRYAWRISDCYKYGELIMSFKMKHNFNGSIEFGFGETQFLLLRTFWLANSNSWKITLSCEISVRSKVNDTRGLTKNFLRFCLLRNVFFRWKPLVMSLIILISFGKTFNYFHG